MKVSLSYAAKTWGIYALLVLLSVLFVAGVSNSIFQIVLNIALLAAFILLAFNEAAYNGEKACTLEASMEKQLKEGRQIDEKARPYVFSRKTGVRMFAICLAPLLLTSIVNLAVAPMYPEVAVQEQTEEKEAFYFDYDAADNPEESETQPINTVNVIARVIYMPFVFSYTLVSTAVLNWLFLLYAFVMPGAALAGYLLGPTLRQKKLRDIALGKKRKMRNLKVHRDKGPRRPKAEV